VDLVVEPAVQKSPTEVLGDQQYQWLGRPVDGRLEAKVR